MSRQPTRGGINRRERQVSTRQKYQQAQQKYLKSEFTYDTHCLIQNLTDKGKKQKYMQGIHLYKSFIQIAKILMMNQLQVLFLGATLEQMKWIFTDNCLNNYINDFKGFHESGTTDLYNKKIQLSLLLIGYIVKLYLNQAEQSSILQFRIRQLMQNNYDRMYQEWIERMKKNFKFSPKIVNKLFIQMEHNQIKNEGEINNYNSKVDDLFKIFMELQTKNSPIKQPQIQEEDHDEQMQQIPLVTRADSFQSLRSLGHRDSEKSQREFGPPILRNMLNVNLFRQNSCDSQI